MADGGGGELIGAYNSYNSRKGRVGWQHNMVRERGDGGEPNAAAVMGLRQVLTETILGYVFWSIYHAVAPMIWFYPLNELEITGFEAFALVKTSPLLLGVGPLRRLLGNRWCMALLRLTSAACLASFQAPSTFQRLVILCVGCFTVQLTWTLSLWSSSSQQRSQTYWGLLLGLFAYLSSRVWFVSFVPTWWSNQSNTIIITLAAIATLDKIISGGDGAGGDVLRPAKLRPNWFLTSLGLSSLIYVTHAIFGEVSVVTRWVVRGYPDPGPMPYPFGSLVLVALFVGTIVPQTLATSALWWVFGACSLLSLLYLQAWVGYIGGLGAAVYTISLWPVMLERAVRCPPARVVGLTALLHIVMLLFSVWTVAYNFVPGGVYTREHTDWLIWYVVLTLGAASLTGRDTVKEKLVTYSESNGVQTPNATTKTVLFLIVLAGLGGFAARYNPNLHSHPAKVPPKVDFTAAIWTYHFGYDNQGWPSLERSAQLLNDTGADVITLLESDASKPFLGNNDLGMWLGERLGMYVDFGVSTRDHTWGNLLLSKYPIVKSTHHMLPSPHGELAPAITATVNMSGYLVDFVVTHMGNDRDVLDRKLQAEVLARELREAKNPVIFLGYVTSAPGSRDYNTLTHEGHTTDIDSTDRQRWCEYIMYRGLIRLGYARVSHGGLSDTEVQMARFRIPEDADNFKDNANIVRGHSKAAEDVRFTSKFGHYSEGHNWITDHRYHMSTPKYFVP